MLVAHGNGYLLAEAEGGGTGTVAVGENVEVGDGQRVDVFERLLEFGLGLSVEAGHDVGSDAGVGHDGLDRLQLGAVEGGVVAAVHELQHMVGTGLQRYVEVGEEGAAMGHKVYDVVGEQIGLDAGNSVAEDTFDIVQTLE